MPSQDQPRWRTYTEGALLPTDHGEMACFRISTLMQLAPRRVSASVSALYTLTEARRSLSP